MTNDWHRLATTKVHVAVHATASVRYTSVYACVCVVRLYAVCCMLYAVCSMQYAVCFMLYAVCITRVDARSNWFDLSSRCRPWLSKQQAASASFNSYRFVSGMCGMCALHLHQISLTVYVYLCMRIKNNNN